MSERPPLPLSGAVAALGASQIVGYGTIYYAYPLLVPSIAAEFGIAPTWLFGLLSVGMLIGGLAAPRIGRTMDRLGAPVVMALGSLVAGLLFGTLAMAPNFIVFAGVFLILECVSTLVFYDAAFAALALFGGARARRAITHLTLIAGFASTLFWPLTGWLVTVVGWRGVFLVFAGLNLLIAFPLHVLLARAARAIKPPETTGSHAATTVAIRLSEADAAAAFRAIALSFALSAVLIAALGIHLVPVLKTLGLGESAYIASMLMGPAQVAIRLLDALFWRNLHPLTVALVSALALPASVAVLFSGLPAFAAGALFALLFGVGQGLSSIVRGSVPLALFGTSGFAERLGRLAAIRSVLSASAPLVFSALQTAIGTMTTLVLMLLIGVVAAAPLVLLQARLRRIEPVPGP